MEDNGGYATLGYLYQHVNVRNWKTKTPFASIRRIVQDSRFFFKIRPGLWALNDYRETVLKKFKLTTKKRKEEILFDHTYYQGLIVEIGNVLNFATHVPNQDKNRLFLEKPLKKIISLQDIYKFTYPEIVKRASTVDVIWFNRRKFPHAFFEIEHSTNFQNSLIKYADLQDFKARFYMVSPAEKRRKFEDLIGRDIFKDIKNRVHFKDYGSISNWHTTTFKLAELQESLQP